MQQPPELDDGETLAGRQSATNGNATLEFSKGGRGDALIVAVRCQGQGKIKVAVPSVHVSFSLECVAGQVGTTYNQVAVSGVDRSGTVSVTAPSAVHWSVTIGRGAPAEEGSPPGIDMSGAGQNQTKPKFRQPAELIGHFEQSNSSPVTQPEPGPGRREPMGSTVRPRRSSRWG